MVPAYHIVQAAVKKLPASAPGMVSTWMVSWAVSWAIACPTMVVMMPIVRRWLLRVIEEG
jgi:hypothetical protein